MGLFSSPVPTLDPRIEEGLSAAFRADVVGNREYKTGLSKLGNEQLGLLAILKESETFIDIVPGFRGEHMYESLIVLTNQRLISFKRQVKHQLALGQISEVGLAMHPAGYVVFSAKGQNYRPYTDRMSKAALEEHTRNYMQVYVSSVEVAQHLKALINGERERLEF
jgi:hypothetical protein